MSSLCVILYKRGCQHQFTVLYSLRSFFFSFIDSILDFHKCNVIRNFWMQNSLQDVKSTYAAHEDIFFGKIKGCPFFPPKCVLW